MPKISFELHDGSVLRNNYEALFKLKEHIPELKVSLFFIPYDYVVERSQLSLQRKAKLKLLKDNLDWIRLYPHGVMHIPNEFEKCDRETMELCLKAIDEAMSKDELPYEKGFCAPFWLWNKDVTSVLDEHGWFGAIDRNQPEMVKTKRTYTYTHSIDEDFRNFKGSELILHGHMTPPSFNNLDDCMLNLLKIPKGEFVFIDEMVK
jgi:hypothetical protein